MTRGRDDVGIIGAGSWGTALAAVAARAGHQVMLWARSPQVAEAVNESGVNEAYLAGTKLPTGITATAKPEGLSSAGLLLVAVPAQAVREILQRFAGCLGERVAIVVCAKGIERGTNRFMTEVAAEVLPESQAFVCSGPSFARDVARGLPTAVTLAGPSLAAAGELAKRLSLPFFRIYASDDVTGVEIGGSVKNVLAIACGICEGKGLGDSARAALTTRAFAELGRFGRALGARPETLTGLSGLGDLILTCSSRQSRNFSFGIALGKGETAEAVRGVIEGVHTAAVVCELAAKRNVEMPICSAVARIVDGRSNIDTELAGLLARPLRPEAD